MKRKVTIVFLHGFACDSQSSFREACLIGEITRDTLDVAVYSPNLPGHCGEPFNGFESFEDLVVDLKKKIEQNIVGPYIVMGFSMGGMLALKYAEMYESDSNLLGICVWSSPLLGLNASLTKGFRLLHTLTKKTPEKVFNKIKANRFVISYMRSIDVNLATMQMMDMLKLVDILDKAKFNLHTNVKKCFVYGSLDPQVNKSSYTYLVKEHPKNSQIYWVKRAGHFGSKLGRSEARNIIAKYLVDLVTNSAVFTADSLAE